jgi:hypothetical protein
VDIKLRLPPKLENEILVEMGSWESTPEFAHHVRAWNQALKGHTLYVTDANVESILWALDEIAHPYGLDTIHPAARRAAATLAAKIKAQRAAARVTARYLASR